jgi:hypothetical protein
MVKSHEEIATTTPAQITNLASRYTLPFGWPSHVAQSKTVDRVFVAQSIESFGASSTEQFFVSISRARENVTVYTDDKARLAKAIQSSAARMNAHELLKLPAATKVIDPFESILREKAIIPTSEKMNQASKPERKKDIERNRHVVLHEMRPRVHPVHQARVSHQHRREISL